MIQKSPGRQVTAELSFKHNKTSAHKWMHSTELEVIIKNKHRSFIFFRWPTFFGCLKATQVQQPVLKRWCICHLRGSRTTVLWPVTPQRPLWLHPSKLIPTGEQLEPSFTLCIQAAPQGFAVGITVIVLSSTHERQRLKRKSGLSGQRPGFH